jgi:dienelactone hydrolase
MQERFFDYTDGDSVFEAFVACDSGATHARPAVLVLHPWTGPVDETRAIAIDFARQGYAAIALDVYGKGRRGVTEQACIELMTPLVNDRQLLARRLRAGVDFASRLQMVDASRMAAVGHCFGGLCVLDMARHGMGLRAVVSIHGVLTALPDTPLSPITTRVLILQGDRDPFAPIDDEIAIRGELTARGCEWELQTYGHAMHAYTRVDAASPEKGMQFHAVAARRSRTATLAFLAEHLG